MARPIRLTDNQAVDWVKDVAYNTAGQITLRRRRLVARGP
jgi:hypothetical protein